MGRLPSRASPLGQKSEGVRIEAEVHHVRRLPGHNRPADAEPARPPARPRTGRRHVPWNPHWYVRACRGTALGHAVCSVGFQITGYRAAGEPRCRVGPWRRGALRAEESRIGNCDWRWRAMALAMLSVGALAVGWTSPVRWGFAPSPDAVGTGCPPWRWPGWNPLEVRVAGIACAATLPLAFPLWRCRSCAGRHRGASRSRTPPCWPAPPLAPFCGVSLRRGRVAGLWRADGRQAGRSRAGQPFLMAHTPAW